MARSELAQRLGAAAVGIPIAIAMLYTGGWVMALALAVIAGLAADEFYRLARHGGVDPLGPPGIAGAGLLVLATGFHPTLIGSAPWLWVIMILLLLVVGAAAIFRRGVAGRPFAAVSTTLTGAIFSGGTLLHAVFLRHLLDGGAGGGGAAANWAGTALVGFAVGLTWLNDTGAYVIGTAFGRRKLIPAVSPGKSVEGSIAGLSFAVITGALYGKFVLGGLVGLPFGVWEGALGGVLLAAGAQIGDLAESLFKREAGVKDSGRLIPGHGGVLDRFDALFYTLPLAYWYLVAILWLHGGGVPWR